jgi:ABC-type glycerol-3-phosphate transport system permease component
MLLTALKPPDIAAAYPPPLVFQPTGDNFSAVLGSEQFALYAIETLVVSIGATVLGVVIGALAAYSMARYRTGGAWIFFALIFVQSLPAVVLGLPFFVMFRQLGLYDTIQGLILSYTTFSLRSSRTFPWSSRMRHVSTAARAGARWSASSSPSSGRV